VWLNSNTLNRGISGSRKIDEAEKPNQKISNIF